MMARNGSWTSLLALWLIVMLTALFTRPLLPVDETRYASVAWEMWLRGDFLVPYLNAEPYSHKPPLYFWLIHAGWWLFGVHEWVVRAVAPLLALLILFATAALSRQLWPTDTGASRLAAWLVFGTTFFTAFLSWVQFDLLLVLMTLLALIGMVRAARGSLYGWLLCGIAMGLGVLSKGPVILLQVLPVALLAPLWRRTDEHCGWWHWYAGLFVSVLVAAGIALAWALPAAQAGGEAYREAILWGQTANRMLQSFAHAHPVWWYLPWLPVLFAPWTLLPWAWSAMRRYRISNDMGVRLCLGWLFAGLLVMSLVSGKQVKYLLPLLPAVALILARVWGSMDDRPVRQRPWLLSGVLLVTGGALAVVPRVLDSATWLPDISPLWGLLLMATAVMLLLLPALRPAQYPLRLALLSVWVVLLIHLGIYRTAAPAYDVQAVSELIAGAQANGHEVAIATRYHGQFGFAGRLSRPLLQLDAESLQGWAARHPHGYLVFILRTSLEQYPKAVFTQPYRSGYLGIWTGAVVAAHADIFQ